MAREQALVAEYTMRSLERDSDMVELIQVLGAEHKTKWLELDSGNSEPEPAPEAVHTTVSQPAQAD